MKKIVFMVAAAAMVLASCDKLGGSASLKTELDTICYEMGIANTQGLKMYLSQRMGIDTTDMTPFLKGVMEAATAGDDKDKAAYFAGLQIGQQISGQMKQGLEYQLFGGDSAQEVNMKAFLAGFVEAAKGVKTKISMEQVQAELQKRVNDFRSNSLSVKYRGNIELGKKFMAETAKKEGVQKLGNGVLYKVLVEGSGEIPADSSIVQVCYEGRLIDGTVFDSSEKNNEGKPIQITVKDMIPGWIEALTHMPVGSKWEIYIPQDQAYGSREAGEYIKPFSTLVFTLELKAIGSAID